MKRKRFSKFVIFVSTTLAVCGAPCRANSPNGTQAVLSVGIHDSGHAIVTLGGSSNTEGCASASAVNMVLIAKTNSNFKAMYATALTALSSGRKLSGWVNGCTDTFGNGNFVVPTATTLFMGE